MVDGSTLNQMACVDDPMGTASSPLESKRNPHLFTNTITDQMRARWLHRAPADQWS